MDLDLVITGNLDGLHVDAQFRVPDAEGLAWVRRLNAEEGICLGLSSGINVAGAVRLARQMGPGHVIVTILCDYGNRYQSKLYNPTFLRDLSDLVRYRPGSGGRDVTDLIVRARLAALEPTALDLVDESAKHVGHAGARPGGNTHWRLTIVSRAFAGKPMVARHRMIYDALGERDSARALSIEVGRLSQDYQAGRLDGLADRLRAALARLGERIDLGMGLAAAAVPAATDDVAIAHDHAAHGRIRRRGAEPLGRGRLEVPPRRGGRQGVKPMASRKKESAKDTRKDTIKHGGKDVGKPAGTTVKRNRAATKQPPAERSSPIRAFLREHRIGEVEAVVADLAGVARGKVPGHAIISAGDGAYVAVHLVSDLRGEPYKDHAL